MRFEPAHENAGSNGIMIKGFGTIAALAALMGAAVPQHTVAAVSVPAFDPVRFFSGSTEGVGQLKKVFSSAHRTLVHGRGTVRADGVLVLDQQVEEQGEAIRMRQWQLRQISPGHFRGTLSDASGPVSADARGGNLAIHYTMSGGLAVDLVLTLDASGQSAHNVMKVTKFGMTVATLDETIRRV